MNATQQLHAPDHSLWLHNITHGLLTRGTLPDGLHVEALAAPDTIDTMPEKTLLAFTDHGQVKGAMPIDGGNAEAVLAEFAREGVNDQALAAVL